MKKFVFISDFDGTITKKDFYWHIIDKYMKEEGNNKYLEWKAGKLKDIDFLGHVFKNIDREENEIKKDILELEIDTYLHQFINFIQRRDGEFVILSAGASYYIETILEYFKLDDITIYSNKAIYKEKGLHYDVDPNHKYYSERYGIDKKKVVEDLKTKYKRVYYAGDSMPDYEPSLICDLRFATGKLIDIFKERDIEFHEFESFKDIEDILREKEV
ncbi:MtnX-like HAD-IB family phosphatase [Anaeromonas frigoriresistens]|nr:MtnX-like HAD-IB family phosphatase [Anaeromonas frigoriresistens]